MGFFEWLQNLVSSGGFNSADKISPYRSVLFVCHANVTRSPSAERMFADIAEKRGEQWNVASAGVAARRDTGANLIVQFILQQRGINLSNHRSQPITDALIKRYHWIIVMERQQRDHLVNKYPQAADRIMVLREVTMSDSLENPDMPDPTGKEVDDYTDLFAILDVEIPRIYKELESRVTDIEWDEEEKG